MNRSKIVAIGALIGIVVGIVIVLFFPNLLSSSLDFSKSFNTATGYPPGFYSIKNGSIYNIVPAGMVIFGLLGALLGYLFSLFYKNKN